MTPNQASTASPRWQTLLALIAIVLGAHLTLLMGPVPWVSADAPTGTTGPTANSAPQPAERSAGAAPLPAAAHQTTALVSTVRWIVPALAPDATITRDPPPLRPALRKPEASAVEPRLAAAEESTREPIQSAPAPAEQETAGETESREAPTPTMDDEMLAAATVETSDPPATPGTATAQPPAQPPSSARLDYAVTGRIKGIAYNAQGKLDWTLADGRYSARMEMRVFLLGSRLQTSAGQVGPSGLMPERFSDKSRSEKAAHFDNARNRIRFSNNAPDAVLLPGAQDRLSLFLQIAGLLQARPQAYAAGQIIELQVAGTGDADIWRFEVGDEVNLSLPAGEVRARLLRRLPRKEFDSTVELWLAPELQHLPVRLRVTQANGDVADQQLSRMP